uniref:Uncharacterized protein n=1 Tax=Arundo donax TaxID=35708 RepID=A0A0A9GCS4_ARUDO
MAISPISSPASLSPKGERCSN